MKASSVRKGNVIIYNSAPHRVMEAIHNTPGNLRASVQMKLRNLLTGLQTENRFGATENIDEADVFYFKATYLYNDGDGYQFMNSETYEQFAISEDIIGDNRHFIQEQVEVEITSFNGNPIGVKPPQTVVVTVVDTEPEIKGATASNSPKPAKTETGLVITVPAFIKIGDKIIVNTEEITYLKRAE
jgi:elongation factor P